MLQITKLFTEEDPLTNSLSKCREEKHCNCGYLGHLTKKFGTKEERKTQRSAIQLKMIKQQT
jgi:hypothetical protein